MNQPRLVWRLPRDLAGPGPGAWAYRAHEMYFYRGRTALCARGRPGGGHCLLVRRGEFASPVDFFAGGADLIEDGLPNRGAALRRFQALADRCLAGP